MLYEKKAVLKIFAKFTRSHLCWRLFLIKLSPFFLHTLFQFGLTITPIQNTDPFYSTWKRQKTRAFLIHSWVLERSAALLKRDYKTGVFL